MSDVLRRALGSAADALDSQRDELTRLDSLQGDGDLGRTAGLIAGAIREALTCEGDAAAVLMRVGSRIASVAPSSSGTLTASAFLGAGKVLAEPVAVPIEAGMRAAIEAIQRRGKAGPGDRTMLDALIPALLSLEHDPSDLAASAAAAEAGADATRTMEAKVGRARFLAGNVVGEPDPGAVMVATALSAALREGARAD